MHTRKSKALAVRLLADTVCSMHLMNNTEVETHPGTKGQFQKKKLMEFSIKGPDPASQHHNGKKNKIKHSLKML